MSTPIAVRWARCESDSCLYLKPIATRGNTARLGSDGGFSQKGYFFHIAVHVYRAFEALLGNRFIFLFLSLIARRVWRLVCRAGGFVLTIEYDPTRC